MSDLLVFLLIGGVATAILLNYGERKEHQNGEKNSFRFNFFIWVLGTLVVTGLLLVISIAGQL